MTADLFAM